MRDFGEVVMALAAIICLTLVILAIILCGTKEQTNTNVEYANDVTTEECQHDWVTVSEYSFIHNAYKTYSKCSKCGKEIK